MAAAVVAVAAAGGGGGGDASGFPAAGAGCFSSAAAAAVGGVEVPAGGAGGGGCGLAGGAVAGACGLKPAAFGFGLPSLPPLPGSAAARKGARQERENNLTRYRPGAEPKWPARACRSGSSRGRTGGGTRRERGAGRTRRQSRALVRPANAVYCLHLCVSCTRLAPATSVVLPSRALRGKRTGEEIERARRGLPPRLNSHNIESAGCKAP